MADEPIISRLSEEEIAKIFSAVGIPGNNANPDSSSEDK